MELKQKSWQWISENLFIYGFYLAIIGLFSGRFTLACGVNLIAFSCIVNNVINPKLVLYRFFFKPRYWIFVFIFLSVLFSFIGSHEFFNYWIRVKIYAPFLLIPYAIYAMPQIQKEEISRLQLFFVLGSGVSCFVTLIHFFMHHQEYIKLLDLGQSVLTPIDHIRFSLACSFSFLLGLYLIIFKQISKKIKILIIISIIVTFISIIMLSVRTGWIITFLGIFGILFHFFQSKLKPYLFIPIFIFSGSALSYLSYKIPAVQTKVNYSLWEFRELQNNFKHIGSDGNRVRSLVYGSEIFKENFLFGVGSGDIKSEITRKYIVNNNKPPYLLPHNQILFTGVCGGIFGVLLLLIGYFGLRVDFKRVPNRFMYALFTNLFFVAMLIEPTFETSTGVLLYFLNTALLLLQPFDQITFLLSSSINK